MTPVRAAAEKNSKIAAGKRDISHPADSA